jgi:hypothetical protein
VGPGVLRGEFWVARGTRTRDRVVPIEFRGVPVPLVPPFGTALTRQKPFEYPLYPLSHLEARLRCASCSRATPSSKGGSWSGGLLFGEAAQVPAQLSKASSRRHVISLPVSPRLLISVEIAA